MSFVNQQKAEEVRLRMVTLLGCEVEMQIGSDPHPVEYRVDRVPEQMIRIGRERFEDRDTAKEVFPQDAVSHARLGGSFLLRNDDLIVPALAAKGDDGE